MKVLRHPSILFLLLLLSFACLASLLKLPPMNIPPIWPSTGISLAFLSIYGLKLLPLVWLGNLFLEFFVVTADAAHLHMFSPLIYAVILATSSSLQASLGSYLIHHFLKTPTEMVQFKKNLLFFALTGPLSCIINMFIHLVITNNLSFSLGWGVANCLGVFIFTPFCYLWIAPQKNLWKLRRFPMLLASAIMTIALGVAFIVTQKQEKEKTDLLFQLDVKGFADALHEQIDEYHGILYGMRSYFEGSQKVERDEFKQYTDYTFGRYSGIQSLEWVPKLYYKDLNAFQKEAKDDGYAHFSFSQQSQAGQLIPAKKQNEYYPIYYLEPLLNNERALGFDLSSNPQRLAAIKQAGLSNSMVMTSPITLVQTYSQHRAIRLFLPVYQNDVSLDTPELRKQFLRGFVTGSFRIKNIIDEVSKNSSLLDYVNVHISDITQSDPLFQKENVLFSNFQVHTEDSLKSPTFLVENIWHMDGRSWRLHFTPKESFLKDNQTWQLWLVMVGGLCFVSLLYMTILLITGQTTNIQQLVKQRTQELLNAQHELEHKVKQELKTSENLNHQKQLMERQQEATLNILEDLEEEKLNLAKQHELLKKVNLELDSFVYTASHDLRSPLRGITSFSQFLREDYSDKLDDDGKQYLKLIEKGAKRMSDLIEDLLALSRISRLKEPFQKTSIQELVDSVLVRLDFDIQECKVQLLIKDTLPNIVCTRTKISEVFVNLISNAIKFSSKDPAKTPQIEIAYQQTTENHQFSIKDNGIGINPDYQKQIFGLFKRLHTSDEYEGTGIGLNIVKRIIDDHQGEIWVESQLGQGATFFFSIPKNLS